MRPQAHEFIRQQLIIAMADLSGSTKGQLQAWMEDAQYETDTHPRKKPSYIDEATGTLITLDNPPIPGKQTRAKGSHIPLVQPIEFVTASWRRAALAQESHERAWLTWCYADSTAYAHQVEIVSWCWSEFAPTLKGKRVIAKMRERLRDLVWLAAQDVKAELRGKGDRCYKAVQLAGFVGVKPDNWSRNYAPHWSALRACFLALDARGLSQTARTRGRQKATARQSPIA
ncbi:antiterminator [Klebsiella variicola]|nr:antiterminator [Klebsiella variicola]